MRWLDHGYIFATIILAVFSQIVMRWQIGLAGDLPVSVSGKILFVMHALMKPWIILAIVSTFFSGIAWMLAMTKFDVSYAFPFVSLNFVLVLLFGHFFLHEPFGINKLVGASFIVLGIIVIAKVD